MNNQEFSFEEVISVAKTVSDARSKAANELRAYAVKTFFPQVAQAIRSLDCDCLVVSSTVKLYNGHPSVDMGELYPYSIVSIIPDDEQGFRLLEGRNYNFNTYEYERFNDFDEGYILSFYGLIDYLPRMKKELIKEINRQKGKIKDAENIINS